MIPLHSRKNQPTTTVSLRTTQLDALPLPIGVEIKILENTLRLEKSMELNPRLTIRIIMDIKIEKTFTMDYLKPNSWLIKLLILKDKKPFIKYKLL